MPNTVALNTKNAATVNTSENSTKTEWDLLCEWGTSEAELIGWTEKDSEELLQRVRKAIDEGCY